MRKRVYGLADKQGYIRLANEYEQHTCVSFERQKKETTVITADGRRVYPLGDMVIDFVTLEDDGLFALFEEDRLQLIEDLHLFSADDFNWDFSGYLDEFTENYLVKNNISKDDFAKKLAILDFVQRYEELHPYLSMLDLYTAILPCDNDMLLGELLDLKSLKQKASELVSFCFDIEMEHLKKLSAEKRYYFYHASGRGSVPQSFKTKVVTLPNKIPSKDYNVFYKTLPADFDVSKVWELTSLHDLKQPQDVTADTAAYLDNADIKLYETYEVSSVADMVYLELYQMLLCNSAVKKCALCGRYFVMKGDYSTKYCDRKMKGKKQTCQQLGASRDFNKRKNDDPVHIEYMKAYKRMHSRIKYGMVTREKFTAWREEAQKKMELCRQGAISLEEFHAWLEGLAD